MSRKRATKAFSRHTQQTAYERELERALLANGQAREAGPTKRKTWAARDLKSIEALTPPQTEMIHDYLGGQNIFAGGSAGTGKTFVALYLALQDVLDPSTEVDKIILVRSVVATRDVGHLPGTLEEKTQIYERPYKDIFHDLMGRASTYQDMKDAGMVTFDTTSFIRGMTFDNAVIVVDEGQNMTFHEINSIMTRLGTDSRIIFVGDLIQTDLRKHRSDVSGMEDALKVAERINKFTTVRFTKHDIVRSEFVKSWIIAAEEEGLQ